MQQWEYSHVEKLLFTKFFQYDDIISFILSQALQPVRLSVFSLNISRKAAERTLRSKDVQQWVNREKKKLLTRDGQLGRPPHHEVPKL